jgi:hypothetical protein
MAQLKNCSSISLETQRESTDNLRSRPAFEQRTSRTNVYNVTATPAMRLREFGHGQAVKRSSYRYNALEDEREGWCRLSDISF